MFGTYMSMTAGCSQHVCMATSTLIPVARRNGSSRVSLLTFFLCFCYILFWYCVHYTVIFSVPFDSFKNIFLHSIVGNLSNESCIHSAIWATHWRCFLCWYHLCGLSLSTSLTPRALTGWDCCCHPGRGFIYLITSLGSFAVCRCFRSTDSLKFAELCRYEGEHTFGGDRQAQATANRCRQVESTPPDVGHWSVPQPDPQVCAEELDLLVQVHAMPVNLSFSSCHSLGAKLCINPCP